MSQLSQELEDQKFPYLSLSQIVTETLLRRKDEFIENLMTSNVVFERLGPKPFPYKPRKFKVTLIN